MRNGWRRAGVHGNERLTAATAAVLFVLLAAEGVTIVFLRPLLTAHVFIGVLLIPPVLLKIGSTSYRAASYYRRRPAYRSRGAPHPVLRWTGPLVVASTVTVLASGVALVLVPPGRAGLLVGLHKGSFVGWFGLMTVHVLGHLRQTAVLTREEWLTPADQSARVAGRATRRLVLAAALAVGLVVAVASLPLAGPWLHWLTVRGRG